MVLLKDYGALPPHPSQHRLAHCVFPSRTGVFTQKTQRACLSVPLHHTWQRHFFGQKDIVYLIK